MVAIRRSGGQRLVGMIGSYPGRIPFQHAIGIGILHMPDIRVRNGTSGGPYSLWKRLDDPSTQMIVCLMAKFRQASGDIIYDAAAGNAANSGWIRVMACEVNSHARGRYYHGRTCGRDTL